MSYDLLLMDSYCFKKNANELSNIITNIGLLTEQNSLFDLIQSDSSHN